MKRFSYILLLLIALPSVVAAQVDKSVEVTKEYRPSLEHAAKLALQPDMTDTVKIYPEIDYSITPLSIETSLKTRPIRPARLTYWDFNRSLPFYLKVGAGYPANSVLDFYASTHNPGRGYVVGAVNHQGNYSKLRNDMGVRAKAWQMDNRAMVAAGKYFGNHLLEGRISYDNNILHRYGEVLAATGSPRAVYGDARFDIRVGDEFHDLSRLNFEVVLRGNLFDGRPDTDVALRGRQTGIGASARIARNIGRSAHRRFSLGAAYDHLFGARALEGNEHGRLKVGLSYGRDGGTLLFEVGADYYHDNVRTSGSDNSVKGNYIIPHLRFEMDLGTTAMRPYLELDGEVCDNSYRSLVSRNPYLASTPWFDRSSVTYLGRLGIGGFNDRNRFSYRIYAEFKVNDNHLYWYSMADADEAEPADTPLAGALQAVQARQTVVSLNVEGEFRPLPELLLGFGLRANLCHNDSEGYHFYADKRTKLEGGDPIFEGDLRLRYTHPKFEVGVSLAAESPRRWTTVTRRAADYTFADFDTPFGVDLGLDVVWKLSHRLYLFAEGRNLANRDIYSYPWYRGWGARFTAGAKLNF